MAASDLTPQQLDFVRQMVAAERGLAVIATARRDGTVQATVVNAGLLAHPVTGEWVVAAVLRGDAVKLRLLRRHPRATVVFRQGWRWVSVEGPVQLAGPDDPLDGLARGAIPQLLRDVFTAAGGTHDNWPEYDRVMAEERRTAALIALDRVYTNRWS